MVGNQELLAIVESCHNLRHYLEGSKYPVRVLTNYHNMQEFMKNKLQKIRLCQLWETLSGYNWDEVHQTGKTNKADGQSPRPDYEAAAKAEDCQKQAEEQT